MYYEILEYESSRQYFDSFNDSMGNKQHCYCPLIFFYAEIIAFAIRDIEDRKDTNIGRGKEGTSME